MRRPSQASRHGAADVFQAGERRGALERTRFRAQQLGLKALEQSLKLLQPAVPQLGAGEIFVILFSCLSRGPDDQGLSQPRVTIDREGLSDGGSKRLKTEKKGRTRFRRSAARRAAG